MITAEQLEQLKAFDGVAPVLSVYLNVPPSLQPERAYIATFKTLAQEVRARLQGSRQELMAPEVEAVGAWLERETPEGQGFVAFSCQPAGLWQVAFLPVAVKDHVAFEEAPHLTPLLDIFDEYERYGVVIVDQEQARLLTVHLGQVEGDQRFRDDVDVTDEHTGWDEGKYERQHDDHVHQHYKHVAQRLDVLHRRRPFDRLIVGGPQASATGLQAVLSQPLTERLAGTFNVDIDMSASEVLARTLVVAEQAERESETQLVARLFDLAAPDGRAIHGVSDTLRAVWNAAVQTLVVAEGVSLPGGECTNCGRLEAGNAVACPSCQGATRLVGDVVSWAVDRTLQQAGEVEIVHGEAATRLLEEGGGMGALLRFGQDRLA